MESNQIYAELTEVFRELFSDDRITLKAETNASDIAGWDSFNHLSVIVAVETRFGVKLTTREIDGFVNVGDLVSAIKRNSSSPQRA
jgi:acyl carrier protein